MLHRLKVCTKVCYSQVVFWALQVKHFLNCLWLEKTGMALASQAGVALPGPTRCPPSTKTQSKVLPQE